MHMQVSSTPEALPRFRHPLSPPTIDPQPRHDPTTPRCVEKRRIVVESFSPILPVLIAISQKQHADRVTQALPSNAWSWYTSWLGGSGGAYGERLCRICRHISLDFLKHSKSIVCHCKHYSLGFGLTALDFFTVLAQLADRCSLHLLLCELSGFKTGVRRRQGEYWIYYVCSCKASIGKATVSNTCNESIM